MDPRTATATDTIPRTSLENIVTALGIVASAGSSIPFDELRIGLVESTRSPPPLHWLPEAMFSQTKEAVADLRRLKLVDLSGASPRQAKDPHKRCFCRATPAGTDLARAFEADPGCGYDALFALWYGHHPHFAAMMERLLRGPFFVPEFGLKHLGLELICEPDATRFAEGVAARTVAKLPPQFFKQVAPEHLNDALISQCKDLHMRTVLATASNRQAVVEKIQNAIVTSIIACEQLNFDLVSLKHILNAARDFKACSSTSMLPGCGSRTHFITCDLRREENGKVQIAHHGVRYADARFAASLRRCYETVHGASMQWVNAYVLRAQVCVDLAIQQEVFDRCLNNYVEVHPGEIGTELSFGSESGGERERCIEVRGKEIGYIQLTF